jgi:hypothetical protein
MSVLLLASILIGSFTLLCVAIAIILDAIISQVEKNL